MALYIQNFYLNTLSEHNFTMPKLISVLSTEKCFLTLCHALKLRTLLYLFKAEQINTDYFNLSLSNR